MLVYVLLLVLLSGHVRAQCTNLELPWGTYTAKLDQLNEKEICVYSNVRFAQPPLGKLRFQAPQEPPSTSTSPAEPVYTDPVSCVAVNPSEKCVPGDDSPIYDPKCPNATVGLFQEDCLFLDIYVPLSVLQSTTTKASVAVWFFGGAFLFGSKHEFDITQLPLYSGTGVLSVASEPLIFVAGNYRLGAFGWLAGSYMETAGAPNAGLLDQRMILSFVQQHIGKVNGDSSSVSAWGESAGAGSILHHLVAKNGQQDPLFSRAILQSPAYQWQWNRTGTLNDTYSQFATFAKCFTGDMSCLQSADESTLREANQELFRSKSACQGIFPVGPSLDNSLVLTLPAVALQNGQYWKGLDSILISHVADEVKYNGSFIPYPIRVDPTAANFDNFLEAFMPGAALAPVRAQINAQYPVTNYNNDQINRTGVVIRDSSFTCNTRQLFDAYSSSIPTYMMNYHFLGKYNLAVHASDLLPTFVNNGINVKDLLQNCFDVPGWKALAIGPYIKYILAPAYQSYLKSFAVYQDPNKGAAGKAKNVHWTPAYTNSDDDHDAVRNVMQPYWNPPSGTPFEILAQDSENTATSCQFWNHIATEVMNIVGPDLGGQALRVQAGENVASLEL